MRNCKQKVGAFEVLVQEYGRGGIIGFNPEDINGGSVGNCSVVNVVNPIVKDLTTCEHYGQGAP